MILQQTNGGFLWVFTDEECRDFAYICACLPTNRMAGREADFVRRVESKFRACRGGHLTQGQWNWFAELANRYRAYILGQEEAVESIREFVVIVSAPATSPL